MKHTALINYLILFSGQCQDTEMAGAMRAAADVIREQEGSGQKWIPTSEQLPKPYEDIILARVYEPGKPLRIEAGMLKEGGWWKVFGTNVRRGVLYWMPMPAAPEEEA